MELNLLRVIKNDGKKLDVECEVDLREFPQEGFRILKPVCVKGSAVSLGGCPELCAECTAELELVCDRCAESFNVVHTFELNESFRKADETEDAENPDAIVYEGDSVELDSIVYDALSLSIPTKVLCKDDCAGLCPSCGKNLNTVFCDCKKETDPRFDILDSLL